jgi:hypothetical protein
MFISSSRRWGTVAKVVAVAALVALGACASETVKEPERTRGKTYDTPQAAVEALVSALRAGDAEQLKAVLGPGSEEVLSSGDEVADAAGRAEFLRLYDEKHALEQQDEATAMLDVGATEWPLPIPIVKGEKGWSFDTEAGKDEMLSRRIGRNELAAIQVCLAIADAQREYVAGNFAGGDVPEYAQKLRSSPGKRDGLYWPTEAGQPESPMGDLVAAATEEGYALKGGEEGPRPYHGYYYRLLTAQGPAAPGGEMEYLAQGKLIGGFAVVAWPAEYGNSGLKTFMVSHQGVVYEKDMGEGTDALARTMTVFNPDGTWQKSDAAEAEAR